MTYRVVVSGMVQGVGFRASMMGAAQTNRVAGWVRNREDGAVEALLQGEEEDVNRLLDWARRGPPGAAVTRLERRRLEDCPPQVGFRVLVRGP